MYSEIAVILSPLVGALAALIAYLAIKQNILPEILVYYAPNDRVQSFIDLVVENAGGGTAYNLKFSTPIPVACFGIEKSDGSGKDALRDNIPSLSPRQRYIFLGGQYGGLHAKLADGLSVSVCYTWRNPFGISCKRTSQYTLSVSHLLGISTRPSAEEAIVDALKGPNKTTLQRIEKELQGIKNNLEILAKGSNVSSKKATDP